MLEVEMARLLSSLPVFKEVDAESTRHRDISGRLHM